MLDVFFTDHATWFSVPALVGSGVFLLRLAMMSLGSAGLDFHHDVSLDSHGSLGDGHHGDAGHAFQILSVQSIAAFLMGFGWGGLGALKGTGWSIPVSVVVAVFCGVAMVWLLGLILKAAYDLQASGNIAANDTVGSEGTVYLNIPASGDGHGQVQVVVDERQRTYDAVSTGPAISSQSRIRVIAVHDDNTLTVMPI